MGNRLKTTIISVAVILLGLMGFVALKVTKPSPPKKKAELASPLVRVVSAKKEDLRAFVRESGNVQPKTSLTITAEVAGKVVKVSPNLQAGYFVSKGELLVEIDPREYRLSVEQFKAQISQLEAEKDKIAQEQVNIELNLEVEEERLKLAVAELERKKRLLTSGSLSQSAIDQQEIETKRLKIAQLAQRNALKLMKSQKDLIKAKIDATRAQLESAGLKLEKTKIFAPFKGRIMEESVEEGQFAQIGQKIAVIFDISAVEIVVQVPGFKIPQLGMFHGKNAKFPAFADVSEVNKLMREHGPEAIVQFRIAGRDLTWKGKVTRVQGQIDVATRTIPMVVEVKDPFKGVVPGKKPPLVPGMFVEVLLKGKLFKSVFKVPRAALHEGKIYLVTDGKLEIRKVKVVRVGREYVYIANGLKDGDKIVISPVAVPIPGQPMRIVAGK